MAPAVQVLNIWVCALVEDLIEDGNVGAAQENIDIFLSQRRGYNLRVKITPQTVRLVVQIFGIVQKTAVELEANLSKGNLKVGKRARGDTSTPGAGWKSQ